MWEPRRLTTLWACYRGSFTFFIIISYYHYAKWVYIITVRTLPSTLIPDKLSRNASLHGMMAVLSSLVRLRGTAHVMGTNSGRIQLPHMLDFRVDVLYCHVSQWPRRGFGLVIGFINNLQVVTTINYNTIADLHNLQSLHTNLFSLSPLIFTDL
jgi:hypothetical protein